ncbi:hypothetical protein [Miltoncostaea marina]|uniref:hypothetical protein n=1 Tax=Miltoncostaea marina TaxID=2843215 RepID=UPI001C3C5161|nr:hypothetical protein [Miltoncostaea marina]
MTAVPIVVPPDVRRLTGIPDGPLVLVSVWAMGERRGLWVGRAGQSSGQRWPITGVAVETAQEWIDAAQRAVP